MGMVRAQGGFDSGSVSLKLRNIEALRLRNWIWYIWKSCGFAGLFDIAWRPDCGARTFDSQDSCFAEHHRVTLAEGLKLPLPSTQRGL